MTESIRGLIVDDTPENISSVSTRLDQYLSDQGWKVHWTMLGDPDIAHQALNENERFDLIVIDLLFPRRDVDDDEARGLELVELARRTCPRSFIFVISTGDIRRHDLFAEAERYGADKVITRAQFTVDSKVNGPQAIASEIRRHLLANGTVTEVGVTSDLNDPAVQSLLFEVKAPTLAQLHRQILSASDDITDNLHVRYLSPGASGASVCETKARLHRGRTVHHVVKVSRALDALQAETQRTLQARQLLPSRFVVPHFPERPVGPVNGWYATGAPRDQEVVTLRSWLASGPPPQQAEDLFEVLFTECLGPLYADNMEEKSGEALSKLDFPHYKQRLILQAVDELTPTLTRAEGGALDDISALRRDITAFTTEGRINGLLHRELPPVRLVTHVHGDLHGGNILLYQGRHPVPALIDFSDFGEAHWASDIARLIVDLVMRVIDAGADSMFFAGFSTWRTLMSAVGRLSPDLYAMSDDASTSAALAGLRWLAVNTRALCPPLTSDEGFAAHRWEWHTALCVFLLRSIYHYELTGPKRALALVAAHDQLLEGAVAARRPAP